MKRTFLFAVFLFIALPVFATVFGTVRGIVHDPQHRPVQDVTVTLKAKASTYVQTAQTDANGEFHFGTAPILHFELKLESITPTTLVNRLEISDTPGASRTNSLALITDYVPGSYVVHDQLHVRGGHQVTWTT